jgi:hypothetical protein
MYALSNAASVKTPNLNPSSALIICKEPDADQP